MKRRIFVGSAALVALLSTALVLRPDGSADAAPGDIDLELSVNRASTSYDHSSDPHQGVLQLDLTYDDHDGALTVTAEDIVVDLNLVTDPGYVGELPPTIPDDTDWEPGSAVWTIDELDPGQVVSLVLRPQFDAGTGGSATIEAEVVSVADGQDDVDSTPGGPGTIGEEDDETVYRLQDTDGADPFTGLVWNDVDGGGFFDLGEPPVADTFVRIEDDVSGDTIFWGRTDEDGTYSYGHLPDSTVDVEFTPPTGFTFTTQQSGANGSDPNSSGVVAGLVVTAANRAETDAGLVGAADLSLTKDAGPEAGTAPFTPTYTIEVRNAGPSAASGIEVQDVLPSAAGSVGSLVASHGSASYDDPSDTITWDFGSALLLAGESATLTYEATYAGLGTFTNRAQVTAADQDDPTSTPDPASTTCAAQAPDDDCDEAAVQVVPEAVPSDDEVLVPQGVPVDFNPLDGDGIFGRGPGEPLPGGWSFERLDATTQGSITCDSSTGACTYTPVSGYAGPDGFSYRLTSPTSAEFEQDVDIEVLHVNSGPTARDDRATTGVGSSVEVDVLANDEDPDAPGDTLSITDEGTLDPASAGTWECDGATGPCTFEPDAGFTGEATVTYTVADAGLSDPRVEDPGVPGGIPAEDPQSDSATVTLVVDPDLLPTDTGFTGGTGDLTEAETVAWNEQSTSASADAACVANRPEVDVSWSAVDRADGYLVERRAADTDPWIRRTVSSSTSFIDTLVGEGVLYEYRVSPLVGRWTGAASTVASDSTPTVASPEGCA